MSGNLNNQVDVAIKTYVGDPERKVVIARSEALRDDSVTLASVHVLTHRQSMN